MKISKKWKILGMVWLLLVLAFILYKGVLPGWSDIRTDFNNYYASAALWLDGESISEFYDNHSFAEKSKELGLKEGAKFSPFPPPSVLLYAPLTFWEFMTAKRIWLILNLAILLLLPFRLRHYFNSSKLFSALIISLFAIPIASNLHFGQFYLLAAFMLIEMIGISQFNTRSFWPGLCIGFLAVVKYVPLLFTLYLIRPDQKKWSPFLGVFLSITLITVIFTFGYPEAYEAYFHSFSNHLNGDLSGQGKFAVGFQSADALLNLMFVSDPIENPTPIFNAPILKPILKAGLILIILGSCFWLFRRERYRFNATSVSIFILGAFLIIPASASYHFLLLILPLFLIFRWLISIQPIYLIIVAILCLATFSIQYHHIPTISSARLINLVIHFPRFWLLFFLFGYLMTLRIKKHG